MYDHFMILSSFVSNYGGSNMMLGRNKKKELHRVRKYMERDILLTLGIYHIKMDYKMDKHCFHYLQIYY